jgi:hypothetical protein
MRSSGAWFSTAKFWQLSDLCAAPRAANRLSLTRVIDPDVVSHYNLDAIRRACPPGALCFRAHRRLQPTNG